MNYTHIKTRTTLTLVVGGVPYQIDNRHPNFLVLLEKIDNKEDMDTDTIIEMTKPMEAIGRMVTKDSDAYGEPDAYFEFADAQLKAYVYGQEVTLPRSLTKQILYVHRQQGNLRPLFNFFKKAATNSEPRALSELFDFIATCGLAITTQGNFLAYKRVRKDYKDIFSGTMDNSPNTVISMPRELVDNDKDRTCSAGLHFAAWEYLNSYASSNANRTVLVSINPRDVVAIPSDYKNQKGRACRYKIVRDVTKSRELREKPVWDEPEMVLDDNEIGDTLKVYDHDEAFAAQLLRGEWTQNLGNKAKPIVGNKDFEIRLRNGAVYRDNNVYKYRWLHNNNSEYDIMYYRIFEEENGVSKDD